MSLNVKTILNLVENGELKEEASIFVEIDGKFHKLNFERIPQSGAIILKE